VRIEHDVITTLSQATIMQLEIASKPAMSVSSRVAGLLEWTRLHEIDFANHMSVGY